ncbi:MAG TPA: family 1 glycosylhydrolase [Yinghuangia sp.]|nr:family 1 glycosylhydrolase [Yinghuangia sp.]
MANTPDLRNDFLWGAATSAHQTEGNNVGSDMWRSEARRPERSGDACDSYHRYPEDMRLLADAGLNAYRFGIEWARIEPEEGLFSNAQLAHYRRMIDTARELGVEPVVTLHHFSSPYWFTEDGGWTSDKGLDRFVRYVEKACTILDGVTWVCTMNEPNMVATSMTMRGLAEQGGQDLIAGGLPTPLEEHSLRLVEFHKAAVQVVRERTSAKAGWTVAQQSLVALPGGEAKHAELQWLWEDLFLEAARGDDFLGVQSYSSKNVDADGIVKQPDHPDNTLTGWAYRPDALGIALRHAWEVTLGLPLMVTENGIATGDDNRRIDYTTKALQALYSAVEDGVDVRGYLHWSAIDNYEWGHWAPTFGLIAFDRETFVRTPKPSLAWLGGVARRNGALESSG